jgi:phosphoribosylaminoimidazole (AIR) synthetase
VSGKIPYEDAGVDIDAKERALEHVEGAIRRGFAPRVLGDIHRPYPETGEAPR